jgi:hypothetical protein
MGNLGGLAQGLMEGLGYDLSGTMSDAIIVHELTHALDDQHFDLGGVMDRLEKGDSDDAALAYQSLGEGDATRVMNDYAYQELGIDSSTMNEYSGLSHSVAEAAMNYPPFLERLMVTPYVKGEALVRYLLDQGGEDAVNAAFQRPPESMEQIMHPDRFYPNRDNPSSVAAPDLSAALPGWHKEAQDTLGELITGFMFEVGLNDADKGARIADGWDGDRLSTWRASNNDLAMGWVTAWDSNAEADEFYTSYQELIEARYHNEGTWQDRGPKYSEYVGMGRAAAIEISDNTVVILEGVPEGDVDKCLDAIWNTPVTYR